MGDVVSPSRLIRACRKAGVFVMSVRRLSACRKGPCSRRGAPELHCSFLFGRSKQKPAEELFSGAQAGLSIEVPLGATSADAASRSLLPRRLVCASPRQRLIWYDPQFGKNKKLSRWRKDGPVPAVGHSSKWGLQQRKTKACTSHNNFKRSKVNDPALAMSDV
jgi:hypothetical protein